MWARFKGSSDEPTPSNPSIPNPESSQPQYHSQIPTTTSQVSPNTLSPSYQLQYQSQNSHTTQSHPHSAILLDSPTTFSPIFHTSSPPQNFSHNTHSAIHSATPQHLPPQIHQSSQSLTFDPVNQSDSTSQSNPIIRYLHESSSTILTTLAQYWDSFKETTTTSSISDFTTSSVHLDSKTITILTTTGLVVAAIVGQLFYRQHQSNQHIFHRERAYYLTLNHFQTERFSIIINLSKVPHVAQKLSIPTLIVLHQVFGTVLEVNNIGTMSYTVFTQDFLEPFFTCPEIAPILAFSPTSHLLPHQFFTFFDTRRDQQIDFLEFVDGIITLFTTPLRELFSETYKRFDTHDTDAFTIDQACSILETLNPYGSDEMKQYLRISSAIRPAVSKSTFSTLSHQYCIELFEGSTPNFWNSRFFADLAAYLGDLRYNHFSRTLMTEDESYDLSSIVEDLQGSGGLGYMSSNTSPRGQSGGLHSASGSFSFHTTTPFALQSNTSGEQSRTGGGSGLKSGPTQGQGQDALTNSMGSQGSGGSGGQIRSALKGSKKGSSKRGLREDPSGMNTFKGPFIDITGQVSPIHDPATHQTTTPSPPVFSAGQPQQHSSPYPSTLPNMAGYITTRNTLDGTHKQQQPQIFHHNGPTSQNGQVVYQNGRAIPPNGQVGYPTSDNTASNQHSSLVSNQRQSIPANYPIQGQGVYHGDGLYDRNQHQNGQIQQQQQVPSHLPRSSQQPPYHTGQYHSQNDPFPTMYQGQTSQQQQTHTNGRNGSQHPPPSQSRTSIHPQHQQQYSQTPTHQPLPQPSSQPPPPSNSLSNHRISIQSAPPTQPSNKK